MQEGFKFAGVTLDWYDDHGETLKQVFPSPEDLPGVIKTASIQEKEKLPNEAFALIMIDSGYAFRKYACADPGTTAMSVIYFMEHGDKLPEDAQKTAATNLVDACVAHGIMPPAAMTKVARMLPLAMGGGAIGGGLLGAGTGALAAGEGNRLRGAAYGAGAGAAGGMIGAGLGTIPGRAMRAAANMGGGGHMVDDALRTLGHGAEGGGAILGGLAGGVRAGAAGGRLANPKESEKEPEKTSSVVDVTGQSPKTIIKQAAPELDSDYAVVLPDGSRHYPIHNWDMVKHAEDYFTENRIRMEPEIRREYAVKLAQKAFILGYPLDQEITELGARGYHNDGHIKAAMEMRKSAIPDQHACAALDELFEKRAEIPPEVFAECVRRIDVDQGIDRGWDHVVLDPWASTFGVKTAEVVWELGADRVTDDALRNLAENHTDLVMNEFTENMAEEFKKDPIGIFKSMPDPNKKLLARMAADSESLGGSEAGTNVGL